MTKTKTTPDGNSSCHWPRGMATARIATAEAEEQFEDAGNDSQDCRNWQDPFNPEAAKQGEGEPSKSEGKTGDQPQ